MRLTGWLWRCSGSCSTRPGGNLRYCHWKYYPPSWWPWPGRRSRRSSASAPLPPGGLAHTRYLCKRLRARLPEARIVVGRWGLKGNVEQNLEQLREAGADQVETTLLETCTHLHEWLPVLEQEEAEPIMGAAQERRMAAV